MRTLIIKLDIVVNNASIEMGLLAKLQKIYSRLNILAGFPGEDQKSFKETLDFVNTYTLHENIIRLKTE